jgi:hypothetical protein
MGWLTATVTDEALEAIADPARSARRPDGAWP